MAKEPSLVTDRMVTLAVHFHGSVGQDSLSTSDSSFKVVPAIGISLEMNGFLSGTVRRFGWKPKGKSLDHEISFGRMKSNVELNLEEEVSGSVSRTLMCI